MNDTTPNIAAIVRECLLSRSGAERVVMGSRMFDVARTIAIASFRKVFLRLKQSACYASGCFANPLLDFRSTIARSLFSFYAIALIQGGWFCGVI
jgi:hypothetical protein